jgi:hybrid cluster-associated redox disulfide protein
MVKKKAAKITINPDISIADLAEQYPQVVDLLVYDYGFHCIGCFVAEFETLQEGAVVHGIQGDDFVKLLQQINDLVNASA